MTLIATIPPPPPLIPIPLSPAPLSLFETFLQYGNLASANLVFIGKEEGLDGGTHRHLNTNQLYYLAVEARRVLLNHPIFAPHRVFLNGIDSVDGWYINDTKCLAHAQDIVLNILPHVPMPPIHQFTMAKQARLHWLLQGNNRSIDYHLIATMHFARYGHFHTLAGNTAMIDYFPLPNENAGDIPYSCPARFINRRTYETYYKNLPPAINDRFRILRNAYDSCPMNISIAYTGIQNDIFRLQRFYETIGFVFGGRLYTDSVNPTFAGYIKPTPFAQRQPFLMGTRVNNNKDNQKVILTPFFGRWTIRNSDIDVISSWI
jgi:hypothetical protein